jgi:ribosomal protein S18 acetylase RimI-like enzyme
MYVRPAYRGRGLARLLLGALEAEARAAGIAELRLETGPRHVEALALYRSSGYENIPKYGEYARSPDSICMAKRLSRVR